MKKDQKINIAIQVGDLQASTETQLYLSPDLFSFKDLERLDPKVLEEYCEVMQDKLMTDLKDSNTFKYLIKALIDGSKAK